MQPSAARTASTSAQLALGAVALFMTLVWRTAWADTHCYGFRNDSAEVATLSFSYHPSTGNVITGAAVDPGKAYPFDGRPWCWNLPEGTTATVAVSGQAAPQWQGTLVLGNGTGTAPSGTYVVGATTAAAVAAVAPAAAATQSGTCLANTYPNNEAYCLTALETGVKLGCGVGHTGISGTITVSHLTVKCRSGKSLKLTCGTATGGRQKCNLSDHQICTDESVRSAADYCAP
jgi:hypothetical protein